MAEFVELTPGRRVRADSIVGIETAEDGSVNVQLLHESVRLEGEAAASLLAWADSCTPCKLPKPKVAAPDAPAARGKAR